MTCTKDVKRQQPIGEKLREHASRETPKSPESRPKVKRRVWEGRRQRADRRKTPAGDKTQRLPRPAKEYPRRMPWLRPPQEKGGWVENRSHYDSTCQGQTLEPEWPRMMICPWKCFSIAICVDVVVFFVCFGWSFMQTRCQKGGIKH